ncbi:MAG: nucleoside deaminase [Bdellovibrionales bacterium]|nr:nucleoside deaminase [Bdellovibrionales bacterium]
MSSHVEKLKLEELMQEALAQAQLAYQAGEVPVGAVIATLDDSRIIAKAHNAVETQNRVSAHAEIIAIEKAATALNNWRLSDVVMCVTLEPCTMCAGAIALARIPCVVFGARDAELGAYGSRYDLSKTAREGQPPRVIQGIFEEDCARLLTQFFRERRMRASCRTR